ncbi:hypothetical protein RhiJN_10193 [Ceratobasidium sp. AG-Ba]|nr:hypothetical protein RhiJN_10193 [Ceratobasidium sp. AG-Ba]QRW10946.1 hypothetical protein RhiLY_09945 [Ceratobasidium sp. AG-Ba]
MSVAAHHPGDLEHDHPPTPHRALKRSASTASLLSPPASVRKPRASKRLKGAVDSDDEHIPAPVIAPKTRSKKGKAPAATTKRARLASPPKSKVNTCTEQTEPTRPSTPPPRVCVPTTSIVVPQTPPRTIPKKGGRIVREGPERDSPNNPFLVERPSSPPALRIRPKRRAVDFTEGPTVGYVFRGVPTTFANPYANQHPPSPTLEPQHPSFLPLDHPDFSPSELTRPQLLFPEAHGYVREGESPCHREPPSTPKRKQLKAPKTPTRRSKRKAEPTTPSAAGPSTAVEEGPKTPEPRTPQRRTRTKLAVTTQLHLETEVRVIKTRSKTTAERK